MRQEYSIVARKGKHGKVYYVRYFLNNRMIPSQWSAKTADAKEAALFAKENKERLIGKYLNRKGGRVLYTVLRNYYLGESAYLAIDLARGRKINDKSRRILHGFIVNSFIPFLRDNKIRDFQGITPVVMGRFQNHLLLDKGLLPQSINRQISGIKAIFSHLFMTGVIERNVMKDIAPLRAMNNKVRGCYSIEELSGFFRKVWDDRKSYLLCALIYSAGLRNSEIQNLKAEDIILKDDVHFLSVTRSKTVSGIRLIPVHAKVREAIGGWVKENNLLAENYLFTSAAGRRIFKAAKKAHLYMGSLLGKTKEDLDRENITFYSGRHFYKTMLNLYNLGDIEELFMGHKVNRKVSERYNHKNKRGEKELLGEARKALEIIDLSLFR
jgi:integrase